MKLTNVALASLKDELIPDFLSFLRQRGLPVWDKDAPEALETRRGGARRARGRTRGSPSGAAPAGPSAGACCRSKNKRKAVQPEKGS